MVTIGYHDPRVPVLSLLLKVIKNGIRIAESKQAINVISKITSPSDKSSKSEKECALINFFRTSTIRAVAQTILINAKECIIKNKMLIQKTIPQLF